ncbi:hypothetical protein E4S40_04040 [Algoriphagus kandeliae]|uniref:Uncharacterized protein n=1 Tax=Algoriphagus kandeliae TaxID=2562278 RepID=A0A4Y9R0X6_9BACT|nr:hypothetical protein [Algoriphagus kandeliae]TFV97818.1 hypothetical protein E4S40_04040 [Algoriphagus kandeliae]
MMHLMTRQLELILKDGGAEYESEVDLPIMPHYLDEKGKSWLAEIFSDLGGEGSIPLFEKIKLDFKINRHLILWDTEVHFNRYRLTTLRSDLYSENNFSFVDAYKRLCRTYEKEAIKAGLQMRIWNGPPIANRLFGNSNEPGDFSGNGASGWKLQAYNDSQIDFLTRIHGYKLIRLCPFETLMTGGSLKRLDQILINPKEEQREMIFNWLMRKIQ